MNRLAVTKSAVSTVVWATVTSVAVLAGYLAPAPVRGQPPAPQAEKPNARPDKPDATQQDDTTELVPRYSDGTPRAEVFTQEYVTDYVAVIAARLNCTFTLESFADRPGNFYYKVIDLPVGHLNELVPLLQTRLPEFEVSRDRHDPTVVHLIDKRLRTWKDYPLDRVVKVNYHGHVEGFFEKLTKAKIPLHLGIEGGPGFNAYRTDFHVELDVDGWTLREMLTQMPSRKQYGRILWEASTFPIDRTKSDELETCVFFSPRWPAITTEPEAAPVRTSADKKAPEIPSTHAP
ncbi:MAG TPA: hypothetical protein VIK18_06295 [Pirellulales bacterium]